MGKSGVITRTSQGRNVYRRTLAPVLRHRVYLGKSTKKALALAATEIVATFGAAIQEINYLGGFLYVVTERGLSREELEMLEGLAAGEFAPS